MIRILLILNTFLAAFSVLYSLRYVVIWMGNRDILRQHLVSWKTYPFHPAFYLVNLGYFCGFIWLMPDATDLQKLLAGLPPSLFLLIIIIAQRRFTRKIESDIDSISARLAELNREIEAEAEADEQTDCR